jgi:hypothetical protein
MQKAFLNQEYNSEALVQRIAGLINLTDGNQIFRLPAYSTIAQSFLSKKKNP